MRVAFAVAVVVVLSGCAATRWNKPGATGEDFADDQLKCQAHVMMSCANAYEYAAICRNTAYSQCMQTRGWQLERVP